MRHRVGASGAASFWAVAAVVASGLILAAGGFAPASAYSGAQAEAQSDPVADPYGFPNIKLCCEHKKKKYRKRRPHDDDGYYEPGPDTEYDGDRRTVRVSCGEPRRNSFSSVEEALEKLGEGGRIRIWPGAACDISGLSIDQAVTIESEDYSYGGRAMLHADSCATIAPGYGSSVVSMRGVDIDGCLVVERGRLDFNEVNLASRSSGDAVRLNGGSFSATDSTIRARGTAINALRGVMVSLSGGGFASGAKAEHVVRLDVDGFNLQNTLIKGGLTGVRVGMLGRYPMVMNRVQVMRADQGEIYQIGPGRQGVVVGGGTPGDDLPSLPSMPNASFSIEGGVIAGYADALTFAPGTRGAAKGVNIVHPGRGIVVGAGASVDLRENKITHSQGTGIELAAGAVGSASFNDIQCDHGSCVCYGGECTSRSDRDFGRGAFRMSGTRCDD